jgi:hypothetical protein
MFATSNCTTADGKQIKSSDYLKEKASYSLQKTVHEKLNATGEIGK